MDFKPAHLDSHEPHHHPQPADSPTPEAVHSSSRPKKLVTRFNFLKKWWKRVVVLLVALGLVWLIIGYIHTRNELKSLKNPSAAGKTEAQQIVSEIDKSIDLPTGETPTLATVNDISKLKNQTFFKNAQNGDKVLIYTRAGRAVLYRPSTKKVIEYSLINLGSQ